MAHATVRRWLPLLLLALVTSGVAGGVLAYRHYHRDPTEDLYLRGVNALAHGDAATARNVAGLLRQKGDTARSHLLEGRLWLGKAQRAQAHVHPAPPSGLAQQVGQLLLAGPGLEHIPTGLRPAAGLMSVLVQNPEPLPDAGQDELHQALAEFTQIQDEGDIGAEATRLAAKALRRLDGRFLAAAGLKALVERRPDDLAARQLLAAIYVDTLDATDAVVQLREWARLAATDGQPYRWMGWLLQEDDPAQAVAAYRQALQANLPATMREDSAKELAGVLADRQHQFADALQALNEVPSTEHEQPDVLLLRARCLVGLDRFSEARPLLDGLMHAQPDNPDALAWRARVDLEQGKAKTALSRLQHAIAISPHLDSAQELLADIYDRLGQKRQAAQHRRLAKEGRLLRSQLESLSKRARASAWDDVLRYQVAARCVQLHRYDEAGRWLHAALACNPSDDYSRQLLAQLGLSQQAPLRIDVGLADGRP
ncbi:MAG TPA: tetratricopeptide repeat protein [Gemmataceae bacterium]|nr:tetratricopeptide repeat protein [Gemmataceae bacterium]